MFVPLRIYAYLCRAKNRTKNKSTLILTKTFNFMKKIFTLLCAAGLLVSTSATAAITKTTVKNKTELQNALNAAATTQAGDISYIYVQGDINLGSFTFAQHTHNIHLVGINDEETGERAQIQAEFVHPTLLDGKVAKEGNTEGDKFAVIFENLRLRDYNGPKGNSKHFFNCKDSVTHYVDSLVFRNCEIYDLCRSFYRTEPQAKSDGTAFAGNMNYFEMSNCNVHQGFIMDNAMPFIYIAQPTTEMKFENNTFYDMPYLNSMVSFGFMNESNGRKAIKFTFNNNTVIARTLKTNALFSFASYNKEAGTWTDYVDLSSEYHFKNNFFLCPTWADDWNNRIDDKLVSKAYSEGRVMTEDEIAALKDRAFTFIHGGLVQIENNVLSGYTCQDMTATIETSDVIPIGDNEEDPAPQGDFTSLAMADVPFAWSDFVDAQNDKFQINNQNPAYTAGKNGAPIGDVNNYTDQVIKAINVSAKVEGSNTVSVSITPVKEKYFTGDQVTITLNDHNTALRTINTFKGWNDDSKETTRVITLEANDIDLTATYEPAVENIISAFDFAVTPTVGQNKLTSYEADVFAEGNQAVAKMYYVPNIVENEVVTGVGETYQAADGSENRFNWRSGKFGEDAADQQVCVLSRKTAAAAQAANKPDYIQFELSTTGLTGIEFSAFCGTDNYGYKTQLADYSLDGTTWTNFAKVDMVSRAAEYSIGEGVLWGWTELKGTLPAAAENQAKVYIRVIGDTTGEKAENGVTEISEESNMFEYLASVLITSGNAVDGIKTVSSKKDAKAEAIYNLMGIKVKGNKSGLYIKGNKKFVK